MSELLFLFIRHNCLVSAPIPGPISKTLELGQAPLISIISSITESSQRKFCPNLESGRMLLLLIIDMTSSLDMITRSKRFQIQRSSDPCYQECSYINQYHISRYVPFFQRHAHLEKQ